jgi:hypothetical protein
LTLGLYKNFPANIHLDETYSSTLTSKQLQQNLIQALGSINRKEFSFEEVANPTIPGGKVIFEFGLADATSFNYIDAEEVGKALSWLVKARLAAIDFFCAIRYYKHDAEKKKPLKFDYFMFRTVFSKGTFGIQVFHERGPMYLSPEDLTLFIVSKINESANKKVLKKLRV